MLFAVALALAASPALAADLPLPGPAPAAPATYSPYVEPVFSWTGFYLGINGGYAFGTSNWYDSGFGLGTGDFTANGFLAGGTVGANYQSGAIVYGIEADGDWSNLDGSVARLHLRRNLRNQKPTGSPPCAAAWGMRGTACSSTSRRAAPSAIVQAGFQGGSFSSSTQVGWTAGAGVEGALAPNWTARVELLYVDFGNASCTTACDPFFGTTTSVALTETIVRAGVDYKFSW